MSLKIDNEFKNLIPPLTAEEYQELEHSLATEGCRDVLITWQGTLIDGHNRYEICTRRKIHFDIKEHSFNNRDEVKEWIIRNQFGRRNISTAQRCDLVIKLEAVIKNRVVEKELQRKTTNPKSDESNFPTINTNEELGKLAGVGHSTIHQFRVVKGEGTPELLQQVLKKEVSINKAYKSIRHKEEKSDTPKTETKEEGGNSTKTCPICGMEKPIERFESKGKYCKDCKKEITYARRDGNYCSIEDFKVNGNELLSELRDIKKPSEEGSSINLNPIISEFENIVNNFCCKINPYAYMNGNLKNLPHEGKLKMFESISKAEEWLSKIKILMEVE